MRYWALIYVILEGIIVLKDLIVYNQKSYQKFCLIYNNGNSFIQIIEGSFKISKIKDYKIISEDELLRTLEESEKPKTPKTIKESRKKIMIAME